jgi:hypothetical protein
MRLLKREKNAEGYNLPEINTLRVRRPPPRAKLILGKIVEINLGVRIDSHVKIEAPKIGIDQIWLNIGIGFSPEVPNLYALLKDGKMLRIGHNAKILLLAGRRCGRTFGNGRRSAEW